MTMEEWHKRSAEEWFARNLSDDLNKEERAYFDQWLAVPEHTENYQEIARIWEQAKFAKSHFATEGVNQAKPNAPGYKWIAALAASILLGVLLIFPLNNNQLAYSAQLTTAIGERQTHQLPDGSAIELSVNSSLAINIDRDKRNVVLDYGEAYFDIASDEARPFKITSNGHVISVLGTAFNVKARGNKTQVLLVEGSIKIDPDSKQSLLMTPGQQTELISGQPPAQPNKGNPATALAWRHGKAVFSDTPLTDVIESFKNYHNQQIVVDPSAATLRISGVIPIENYDTAIETLGKLLPISVKPHAGGYIILSR